MLGAVLISTLTIMLSSGDLKAASGEGNTTLNDNNISAGNQDQADINPDALYADQPLDSAIKAQNPTLALFKSMLVPGLGQIGNKKYIKAGVIILGEGALIATLVHYIDKTSKAKEAFEQGDEAEVPKLFRKYQSAKDQRNSTAWFTGTLIFLSMFDAYVDAHLAHFPKEKGEISFDVVPGRPGGDGISLILSCSF